MSFFIYDISFLIAFSIFVAIFLFIRRKKLQRDGILFLYRTKVGIRIIDYIGGKYKRLLNVLQYFVIIVGYGLMIYMIYILIKSIQVFLQPEFVRLVKIPPLAPLIPYLPEIFKADFLPPFYFTYWIIALAIVAVVHEFSHGIFSKLNNIKIKSTGFGFLGPFLAAFVEPDEKKIQKLKKHKQIGILSAGTFANVIVTIVFFLIMWLFFVASFVPSGAMFNSYSRVVANGGDVSGFGRNLSINFNGGLNLTEVFVGNFTVYVQADKINEIKKGVKFIAFDNSPALNSGLKGIIVAINNKEIKDSSEFISELGKYKPGDNIKVYTISGSQGYRNANYAFIVKAERSEYNLTLAENPVTPQKAYLGVSLIGKDSGIFGKIRDTLSFYRSQDTYYAPRGNADLIVFIYNLIWWIVLINISVALVNMLPVGIFDGGRVFYLTMAFFFKEKVAKILFRIATYFILALFLILMLLYALAYV